MTILHISESYKNPNEDSIAFDVTFTLQFCFDSCSEKRSFSHQKLFNEKMFCYCSLWVYAVWLPSNWERFNQKTGSLHAATNNTRSISANSELSFNVFTTELILTISWLVSRSQFQNFFNLIILANLLLRTDSTNTIWSLANTSAKKSMNLVILEAFPCCENERVIERQYSVCLITFAASKLIDKTIFKR